MSYMLRQCCRNGLGKAFHNPSTSCYSNLAGNANAKTPEESKVRGRVPRPSGRLGGVFWTSHLTRHPSGSKSTHGLRFLEIETGEEDLPCVGLWSGKTHYASGFEIMVQSPDPAYRLSTNHDLYYVSWYHTSFWYFRKRWPFACSESIRWHVL